MIILKKLLQNNNIQRIEDLPLRKASELIKNNNDEGCKMINHLVFQGRFTKTPELKTSPNDGPKYVNFTLVWSEKNKNGQEMACFIDCVAFAGLAEFITKYFEKRRDVHS